MPYQNLVDYIETIHNKLLRHEKENSKRSLVDQIAKNSKRIGLLFAGQGFDFMAELTDLLETSPKAKEWIVYSAQQLEQWVQSEDILSKGMFSMGLHPLLWIQEQRDIPQSYLQRVSVSHPLIFIAQIGRYLALQEQGFSTFHGSKQISFVAGYSQGMIPSYLISELWGEEFSLARACSYLEYTFWQGVVMENHWQRLNQKQVEEVTPMAGISGIDRPTLERAIDHISNILAPEEHLTIAIHSTRNRFVVSGPAVALKQLHTFLSAQKENQEKKKKIGQFGGNTASFQWETVPVAAAFHNPMMRDGMVTLKEKYEELGFAIHKEKLTLPILRYDQRGLAQDHEDVLQYMMESQFILPVNWFSTMADVAQEEKAHYILDLGPGAGLARICSSTLRGSGIECISASTAQGQQRLFTSGAPAPQLQNYEHYRPTIIQEKNKTRIDNAFTQATGRAPIILPGMTPTTADVDIVAAAANAGYVAELAGGGQVNERIFWKRMEELKDALDAGQGAVFNALFLDRYLWNLHFGTHNLVIKARQAGYPICGVTISAGIPDTAQAVTLLNTFHQNGIWLNALKAGNVQQVKQIIHIAKELPEQKIFVHLEGGKAGGHHSWEALDHLLLDSYHLIRSCPNLILCVGGGIATEERSTELLLGTWSQPYNLIPMPVDAILLGTICMATKEAKTSPQVKQALVDTTGTDSWVYAGTSQGQMTSGKSQLNADIHYIDNFAAQCGRLLDSVAGDVEAVQEKRSEIIEALNKTAKPYFGDIETMTYAQLLTRMLSLMAVGRHDPYEDGCWPDVSYRLRFADMLWRAEARLHPQEEGKIESILKNTQELDHPQAFLSVFLNRYPLSQTRLLLPSDVNYFVSTICRKPGKPVNFVPIIDVDVRRWYKSDSLWASHDDRFEAEQVLVIPGPQAIAGIKKIDEPVADLFARFIHDTCDAIQGEAKPRFLQEASYRKKYRNIRLDSDEHSITVTLKEDGVDWFSLIPPSKNTGLISFWSGAQILSGDRMEQNIIRRICAPKKGGTIRISAHQFVCHPIPNKRAWVAAQETQSGTVIVQIFDADIFSETTPLLTQEYHQRTSAGETLFIIEENHRAESIMKLYHSLLFGSEIDATPLFSSVSDTVEFSEKELQGYLSSLSERGMTPSLNFMFSLGWKPLFSVLSCPEIRGGLLDLVHLSNDVHVKEAWPPRPNESLTASAQIFRVETKNAGQAVSVSVCIDSARGCCAQLTTEFFIRKMPHHAMPKLLLSQEKTQDIIIRDDAQCTLLRDLSSLTWTESISVGDRLLFSGEIIERHLWDNTNIFKGSGAIIREGKKIGRYSFDQQSTEQQHPLHVLLSFFEEPSSHTTAVKKLIREETCWAPSNMAGYAQVSRDHNPIHQSTLVAQLAGLEQPIVHGMWTAGQMHSTLRRSLRDDAQLRIQSFQVFFDAPLPLGGQVIIRVWKTGYTQGSVEVDIQAIHIHQNQELVVARAYAIVSPLQTAYVFPGQGIQEQNMGMSLYQSSPAAKSIWDQADLHTRAQLGFSIIRVVQKNPKVLHVGRSVFRHPKGVLHLTQFTQVAMATMAQAQVAWLKEEGLFIEDAVSCGHSVGEYNAISAVLGAIPLEEIISVVWHRGLTMHSLVERDEKGRSKYKMGVIRPHYAKMNHQQCEELVATIHKDTGHFIEIVNYNVRGRQYSVTGEIPALERLEEILEQNNQSNKKAYIEVPGIDVPFHSRLLTNGVDDFRNTLNDVFPDRIPPGTLVGKYIPNLTAKIFALTPEFVLDMCTVIDSAPMKEVLSNWDIEITAPDVLAKKILVELLAWQFASPVRWIETQELMFSNPRQHGLGIQEIIEIGSAKQPTLTNMARYSYSLQTFPSDIQIFNIEGEQDRIFGIDTLTPIIREEKEEPAEETEMEPVSIAPVEQKKAQAPTVITQDIPLTHELGLHFLIAKQAGLKIEQLNALETIDEIFEGVSSKRNQLLLDLGTEFSVGTIDAAHEKPISELASLLKERAPSWNLGPYSMASIEEACKRVFGRANLSYHDVDDLLSTDFSLPDGVRHQAWLFLTLESRDGMSIRGGSLGELPNPPADKKGALDFINTWMNALGSSLGISISKGVQGASGTQVDSAALAALRDHVIGEDGVLMRGARAIAQELGVDLDGTHTEPSQPSLPDITAQTELSEDFIQWIQPIFTPKKHNPLLSVWASAHAQAGALYHNALSGVVPHEHLMRSAQRLRLFRHDPRIRASIEWSIDTLREKDKEALVPIFTSILEGTKHAPIVIAPSRPHVHIDQHGEIHYEEVPSIDKEPTRSFVQSMCTNHPVDNIIGYQKSLDALIEKEGDFSDLTVLITGASPDSIAIEIVRQLLRGNARVIVTTTSGHAKRMRFYRDIYNQDAGPHAQLHILPYNQASMQDADALVDWLFETEYALRPNVIIPFGAMKSYGSVSDINPGSEAAMRAMLLGVERVIARVGSKILQEGGGFCHVLLPLSPNHGIFGGDGLYAESKAALEVLLNKCQSESAQWAKYISICGVIIGWVRGTGLMNANNLVAEQLESRLSIRTFSSEEMGLLIAGLCFDHIIRQAKPTVKVDLSGGLLHAKNLKEEVASIREDINAQSKHKKRLHTMMEQFQQKTAREKKHIATLPFPIKQQHTIHVPEHNVPLHEQVVIVGYGEIGPCGSSRTRFSMEVKEELAPGAVAELAWITGLIHYENNAWVDTETQEVISEEDIAIRYRTEVEQRTGIRYIKEETVGFDTKAVQTWVTAYLDKPYRFTVGSKAEAETFQNSDPQKISISFHDGSWNVTMQSGTQIRLPKKVEFTRHVGGIIPDGFDFSRYGIPNDMQESVDRLTLFNLVATVDAWISSGLTPEELLEHVHPARVGNTQSSGIGGMRSLTKLYTDPIFGAERQNDILQETLLNVMAAYVVQSYVGSYGPMSHPVGACATAALSIESGMEKILLGKADFVVTGGYDDIGIEGMFGFGDMNATAPTQEMLDKGLEPKEFSRSNDIRRGGFVEAQGGGTILLARGDIAHKLGLHVYAVLACAGSYSDGIHRSIPAPGKGLLAMALGKENSVLGQSLHKFGLTTNDIGVVYKHDTSTNANDVNENELHHRIQTHLGRKKGNPLWVVSQKAMTGHAKGGAAAWQTIGLCQAFAQQHIPGNKNLSCVDPAMRAFSHMCFTDSDIQFAQAHPLLAGMITSLGFGHVSAGILLLHPEVFCRSLPKEERDKYRERAQKRQRQGEYRWEEIKMGNALAFQRAQHRRFRAKDGSKEQSEEESTMLLSETSALKNGIFVP